MNAAEKIARLLDEESPHAAALHEETPEWLDVERPKRQQSRPVDPPEERDIVRRAIESYGRGGASRACEAAEVSGQTQNLKRWIETGNGLSRPRVERLLTWARSNPSRPVVERALPDNGDGTTYTVSEPSLTPDWEGLARAYARRIEELQCELRRLEAEPAAPLSVAEIALNRWLAGRLSYGCETVGFRLEPGEEFYAGIRRAQQ